MQLQGTGLPVGLFAEAKYEDIAVDLPSQWTLVAMSDGVLEVMDGHLPEKEARLLEWVAEGCRDVQSLAHRLGVDGDVEVPDDVAILVIERKA